MTRIGLDWRGLPGAVAGAALFAVLATAGPARADEPFPAGWEAAPERFVLLHDTGNGGGIWVMDQDGGQVARCAEGRRDGPRVVDIIDGIASPRRPDGPAAVPRCTDWTVIESPHAGHQLWSAQLGR